MLLLSFRRLLEPLAWTVAFALSYAQSPLYTSNQNQYLHHGLARAGGRPEWIHCGAFETAQQKYGATHIVLGPEQLGVDCPQLEEVFHDGQYAVCRITLAPDPSPALRERGWG